jgi:hypothetical protein
MTTQYNPVRAPPIIIPPRNPQPFRPQQQRQTNLVNNYTNPRPNIAIYQGTPSPTTPTNLCPICTNLYDNYTHKKSKIFNCNHEMCRDCILRIIEAYRSQRVYDQNYQSVSRTPLCPFCRTSFIGQETESNNSPLFLFQK